MTLAFGTDGLRGVANHDLTPELVLALGRVAARELGAGTFVVGRDTRRSGPLVQAALSAGLAAEGATVVDLGVIPTPGVAVLAAARGAAGAAVSASHNPYTDNGVKLFAPGGTKLSDEVEAGLSVELAQFASGRAPAAGPGPVGSIAPDPGAADAYLAHLLGSLDGRALDGLRVVLDCANGAASAVAPAAFRRAGAHVEVLHADPDGTNINAGCGSTAPDDLQRAVVASGADAGLAFDGDADRVLAVDHEGGLVDGDRLIALFAVDRRAQGRLPGATVVGTVMANLGFRLAMAGQQIEVVETAVGDRYVLSALEAGGWALGGEQSGHIIFRDLATTGDGILTGLHLLDLLRRQGRPLAELAGAVMTRFPQVLRNVRVADHNGLAGAAEVWAQVAAVERRLGPRGRIVVRRSGTVAVVRVMVEAETGPEAEEVAAILCGTVQAALGPPPA